MMTTQTEIAKKLEISQAYLSQILNGIRPVSWAIAERLYNISSDRDIIAWKNATPEQIRTALSNQAILKCPNDTKAPTEDKVQ